MYLLGPTVCVRASLPPPSSLIQASHCHSNHCFLIQFAWPERSLQVKENPPASYSPKSQLWRGKLEQFAFHALNPPGWTVAMQQKRFQVRLTAGTCQSWEAQAHSKSRKNWWQWKLKTGQGRKFRIWSPIKWMEQNTKRQGFQTYPPRPPFPEPLKCPWHHIAEEKKRHKLLSSISVWNSSRIISHRWPTLWVRPWLKLQNLTPSSGKYKKLEASDVLMLVPSE